MALHLQQGWRNLGRFENSLSLCDTEIGQTNGLHHAFLNQSFHSLYMYKRTIGTPGITDSW
jgi:hypothetical protein